MEEELTLSQVFVAGGEPMKMIFAFLLAVIGLLYLVMPRRLIVMRAWWTERTIGAKFIPSERTVRFYRIFGMLVLLGGAVIWLKADGIRVTDIQQPSPMQGYVTDIIKATRENTNFRTVLFTGPKSQLVVMSIPPGGEVGEETHHYTEQTLFFLSGTGEATLDGETSTINPGAVFVVTAGTKHNFRNTGAEDLKLYTVYAPPNHIDGRVHKTKADADADVEDEAIGETAPQK